MSKIIKVKELKYILSSLGYKQEKTRGSHNIYKHPVGNSLIIFQGRKPYETVPEIILSAIIKNITNSNVATEQEIQKVIETVEHSFNHSATVKTKASPILHSSQSTVKRKTKVSN